MGFERFSITLTNPSGIYNPGQTVVGTVDITNTKTESLKGKNQLIRFGCIYLYLSFFLKPVNVQIGIQVECSGVSHVQFPVDNGRQSSGTSTSNKVCYAQEKYFDAKFSLCNPGDFYK